jgi:tyrosinase
MSGTRSNLYSILSQYQTYNEFSNAGSEFTPIGNLESIHNSIHVIFGPGHMTYLTVSAFDPIFWLHHRFVRLF